MKKLIIPMLALSSFMLSANAKTNMYVRLKNGLADSYDADNVASVYFEKSEVDARQGLTVSGMVDNHAYVNLGLESGTKWATYNLGASRPTDNGDRFAWGETSPKIKYDWASYKWCTPESDDREHMFTKYCTNSKYGTVDNKTVLDLEDDAAFANWGSGWRLPSSAEVEELVRGCEWEWTDNFDATGVSGSLGTSKVNGNTIFLPGVYGLSHYLSSSLSTNNDEYQELYSCSKGVFYGNTNYRYDDNFARAVATGNGVESVAKDSNGSIYIMCVKTNDGKVARYSAADVYEVELEVEKTVVPGDYESGFIGGFQYVDLGLESGLMWATYNVGASKMTEYGNYYAWGETSTKFVYGESTYKWYDVTDANDVKVTKYCTDSEYGTVDNKTVLDAEDDVAAALWGNGWRVPTSDEQKELLESCDWKWTDDYRGSGIAGNVGISKANGNVIFLPAAGYYTSLSTMERNKCGFYGSASLSKDVYDEYYLEFYNYSDIKLGSTLRFYGKSVRAVHANVFIVSFYTKDGVLIEEQEVKFGQSATAPQAPAIDGMQFTGWSLPINNVKTDLKVKAQYESVKLGLYESGTAGDHSYVDLGLKSGTKWATYNVGASKSTEFGDYFAWGETSAKGDYDFSWINYKWCNADGNGNYGKITKYNTNNLYGKVENNTVLDPNNDAATVNWGDDWRMPTVEDFAELIDGCDWEWTEDYNGSGVAGRLGTSKVNGNFIFLPAAGYRQDLDFDKNGNQVYYWSSSLNQKIPTEAYLLSYYNGLTASRSVGRQSGCSVRAVVNDGEPKKSYVVSFFTDEGIFIEEQKVYEGKAAIEPDAPAIIGMKFTGWSGAFDNVTADLKIVAQYEDLPQGVSVSGKVDHYTYVDLGLKSGTKWATYNVGATLPAEYGNKYRWGETTPMPKESVSTYKWEKDDKYCADCDKPELDSEDDAATVNWGKGWRMPTADEMKELIGGCEWEYTNDFNDSGVAGKIGTSKVNGNTIFLPVVSSDSQSCYFWTSTLYDKDANYAFNYAAYRLYHGTRSSGELVRAVVAE